eukprot:scaffold25495_cov30-Tisochrysis_lutea.AAC.10
MRARRRVKLDVDRWRRSSGRSYLDLPGMRSTSEHLGVRTESARTRKHGGFHGEGSSRIV